MTGPDDLKAEQAAMWGSGPFERIAQTLANMHDELVRELAPRPAERWLDVGTGTGAVAMRAARAGASVTGVDLAPALIDTARRMAAESGLSIRYDVGDAERLPYSDGSFDVVASAVGVIFAPDHPQAARELARVCRRGARLGVTAWRPDGGVGDFFRAMAEFQEPGPAGHRSPFDWGRRGHVADLLGEAFELEFGEGDAPYRPDSGEAAWEELSSSYGPTKTLADAIGPGRREQFRRAVTEFYERLRTDSGIGHSRSYLLVLGRRR